MASMSHRIDWADQAESLSVVPSGLSHKVHMAELGIQSVPSIIDSFFPRLIFDHFPTNTPCQPMQLLSVLSVLECCSSGNLRFCPATFFTLSVPPPHTSGLEVSPKLQAEGTLFL